jgi:L,D-transpeptidase catalytic domain
MNNLRRPFLSAIGLSIATLAAGAPADAPSRTPADSSSRATAKPAVPPTVAAQLINPRIQRPSALSQEVLDLALSAANCAQSRRLVDVPKTLTIIDYSLPSTEPRLWVLDLKTGRTLYEEVVAHGRGSGGNVATAFSNAADSHQTSLGLFVTEDTYVGQNGYSMRLNGLEPGVNDQARARTIVMHGASYVDPAIAAAQGRLGRSWGCPALRPAVAKELIDHIKGGNLLFSYYPDKEWLSGSQFLSKCSGA